MRRLLAVCPVALVALLAGCSSSSAISSDKATVARDLHAVKVDQAALVKIQPKGRVVLCVVASGCPTPPPSLPPSSQLTKDTRRLSSDQFRLEGAQKQVANDEAAGK